MTIGLNNLEICIMVCFTPRLSGSAGDETLFDNNALIIQGKFIENRF